MHATAQAEKKRDQMIAAAFIGWQMGAGEKGQKFNVYLKKMGLVEQESGVMTPEEKQDILERAEKADAVCRAWFNKHVKGRNNG